MQTAEEKANAEGYFQRIKALYKKKGISKAPVIIHFVLKKSCYFCGFLQQILLFKKILHKIKFTGVGETRSCRRACIS